MNKLMQLLMVYLLLVSCKEKEKESIPFASTIEINESDSNELIIQKAAHVVPTLNQYEALKNEFIAFIHFGPNTFTRMEWGNGMEDPKIFNLISLDTDQWCKTMKKAGMKMVIITVKHHDGFVLWQSRYTKHGIMSSPFKMGKGDILKELSISCKKFGLKLGIYLSPADLFQIENQQGLYGNLSQYTDRSIPRSVAGRPFENKTTFTFKVDDYNEYVLNQLFELLTEYGTIHEVWFDGAHPKRKGGQTYNYMAWKKLIATLAPKAVIFGRQDIRWCGNESGKTRDTEWNIIPYKENPNKMSHFDDLTAASIGNKKDLNKGKYLHYQQAETNTSIREGWFYRDDTIQNVRSADDVFDIYERSVGGNSTFLLNIPPNREGKFSPRDVKVLENVGKRIRKTYDNNLFDGANGPNNVLDNDMTSFKLLDAKNSAIIIKTQQPITLNRLVIQEAITTHSERIEKHAFDIWINNEWKEIVKATNVGYKRILRFKEVTSSKFRFRVIESRANPAISNISAHYYKTRPPQLFIFRDKLGMLHIEAKKTEFSWKPHGENIAVNLNGNYEIRYTTDGSIPNLDSKLYKEPLQIGSVEVKAIAVVNEEKGSMVSNVFGIIKSGWKIMEVDSYSAGYEADKAFDESPNTFWQSAASGSSHFITIDLGKEYKVQGFAYTPQKSSAEGMIEMGVIKISDDGKIWKNVEVFKFGNLINDPVTRKHNFKESFTSRYIKIESKVIAGDNRSAAIAEIDFY